jgi:hypothetical protein
MDFHHLENKNDVQRCKKVDAATQSTQQSSENSTTTSDAEHTTVFRKQSLNQHNNLPYFEAGKMQARK